MDYQTLHIDLTVVKEYVIKANVYCRGKDAGLNEQQLNCSSLFIISQTKHFGTVELKNATTL